VDHVRLSVIFDVLSSCEQIVYFTVIYKFWKNKTNGDILIKYLYYLNDGQLQVKWFWLSSV